MPVEEGPQDPTFKAFREELLDIVRRRDAPALLRIVNPKIRTSFGPEGGIADFRRHWKPEDPRSPLWPELEFILTHGGKSTPDQFWAPYVYSAWPEAIDAFEYVAVIDKDVPLRESKSASAKSIAKLSYDIVKREEEQDGWTRVTTEDKRTGWVESKAVRSPIDYRAGFVKKGDRWELDLLVAGD